MVYADGQTPAGISEQEEIMENVETKKIKRDVLVAGGGTAGFVAASVSSWGR